MAGEISGLAPSSEHGFHLHATGDCSAPDAKSAGDHFNPDNALHGGPAASPKHLGDIPNITSDAEGKAVVNAVILGPRCAMAGRTTWSARR